MATINSETPDVEIMRASEEDAEAILEIQKLAYATEAEIYGDWTIEPLHETLEEMREAIAGQVVLKAVCGGRIIGSVRGREEGGTCFVGRLIAHPGEWNRGVGGKLMDALEKNFPGARRAELFTGFRSEKNLHFYSRHGYQKMRTEKVNEKLQFVFLEKTLKP